MVLHSAPQEADGLDLDVAKGGERVAKGTGMRKEKKKPKKK